MIFCNSSHKRKERYFVHQKKQKYRPLYDDSVASSVSDCGCHNESDTIAETVDIAHNFAFKRQLFNFIIHFRQRFKDTHQNDTLHNSVYATLIYY